MRVCFFLLFFSCFFRNCGRPLLPHGNRVPGGVLVDGIRVAGGPPAAPAEG